MRPEGVTQVMPSKCEALSSNSQKNPQMVTNIAQHVEKLEHSHIAGGNLKWQNWFDK
jgi:hypothetical protein